MISDFVSVIEKFNESLGKIVWGAPTIVLIILSGIILSVGNGFFHIRYFCHWIRCTVGTLGNVKHGENKSDIRRVSPFQAVCGALASTIGTGNIAGVATAVSAGGPGAVFWMWVSAFFGMMTSYSENTLGIYYRRKNLSGQWCGGPMYYIRDGLSKVKGLSFVGKLLGNFFSIFCVFSSFGMGNMAQSNAISEVVKLNFNISPIYTGVVVAVVSCFIIVGGIERIGSIAGKLVPSMAIFYIICCLLILIMNVKSVPYVFSSIFQNAFSCKAVFGASGGIIMQKCIFLGFKRGIFSNEAGLGSSVIIQSASDTDEPVVQGMWGIFAVFTDTVVICTLTAFVILSTTCCPQTLNQGIVNFSDEVAYISLLDISAGEEIYLADTTPRLLYAPLVKDGVMFERSETDYSYINIMALRNLGSGKVILEKLDGSALVTYAFSQKLGSWSGKLLSVAIVLFAFSTIVGWSYCGLKAWEYLFGVSSSAVYKILYVVCIVLGAKFSLDVIWDFSDIMNALMSFPNLIGLLVCSATVFKITKNYIRRNINSENISPMRSYIKDNKKAPPKGKFFL